MRNMRGGGGAILIWLVLLQVCMLFNTCSLAARTTPSSNMYKKFSAILVLGDSTMDPGNNNAIPTLFRANFPPYGRDYPGHIPTGRFSNGKLIPDMLASALGIKEAVPPILDPHLSDEDLVTGVNFASAGAGFDERTNALFQVLALSKQIALFKRYAEKLKGIVGDQAKANAILNGALVIISVGSNDMKAERMESNDTAYQDLLLGDVQKMLTELYDVGCRSVIIPNLPPIGCLPSRITDKYLFPGDRKCIEAHNSYIQSFNQKFVELLTQLQGKLVGSKLVCANIYDLMMDMINHPQKYGFEETKRGCCGTGFFEIGPLCNVASPTCEDASKFMFWDAIHPSQATYQHLADYILKQAIPKLM